MYLANINATYPAGAIVEYKAPFDKDACQKYGILPTHPVLIVGREKLPFRGYQCLVVSSNIRHYTGYLIDLCDQARKNGWSDIQQPSVIATSQMYTINAKFIGDVLGYIPQELLQAVREAYAYEIGLTDVVPPCRVDIIDKPSIVINDCVLEKTIGGRSEYTRVENHIYRNDSYALKDAMAKVNSDEGTVHDISEDDIITNDISHFNIGKVKSNVKPYYTTFTNILEKDYHISKAIEEFIETMSEDDIFDVVTGCSVRKLAERIGKSVSYSYNIRLGILKKVQECIPGNMTSKSLVMQYQGGKSVFEKVAIRVLVPEWFEAYKVDSKPYLRYFNTNNINTALSFIESK